MACDAGSWPSHAARYVWRRRPRAVRAAVLADGRGDLVGASRAGAAAGVALDHARVAAAERHAHELRRAGDERDIVLGARLLQAEAAARAAPTLAAVDR